MILSLYRTLNELGDYLESIRYPKTRLAVYILASLFTGTIVSTSSTASELPILTVTAVLFGFTINAIVLLGNSSEHYLESNTKFSDDLEKYYKKSLYISIHTLGVGILTIIITGLYQLFPGVDIALQIPVMGRTVAISVVGTVVYTLVSYYLIVFTTVIASTAELVLIRM